MRALSTTFVAAALAVMLISPGLSRAQGSEQIQARSKAIQARVGATHAADAGRRVIRGEILILQRQLRSVDRCLAAAKKGYLVVNGPTGCGVAIDRDIDTQVFILGLTREMTVDEIANRLQTLRQASDASVAALGEQRAVLSAELGRANARLASLVNPQRKVTPPAPVIATCALPGVWRNKADGLGESQWSISADGHAQESGMGSATGTARFSGLTLTIEWTTAGGYEGRYTINFDPDCNHGTGSLIQTKAPAGATARTVSATFTR